MAGRFWVRRLGTAALILLTSSAAVAQQRGQGRGGFAGAGGGKIALVQIQQVQQELKLTDEQQEKVGEIAERTREFSPRRRQLAGADFDRERAVQVIAEEEQKLDELLDAEQKQRLEQISLQLFGLRALAREDVAAKLDLSDDQKAKVREVTQQRQQARAGRDGERRPDIAAMRQRRRQIEEQLLAILTDDQKAKWQEMQGEPFEFAGRRTGER